MSSRSGRKRKKNIIFNKKNFIAILFIAAVAGGGYYYIQDKERKDIGNQHVLAPSVLFHKLENKDTTNFAANIVIEQNINILELSKIFYDKEELWPYILEKNPNISNPLDITKGTIIKVPKVSHLATDEAALTRAKVLGDSLMDVINARRYRIED